MIVSSQADDQNGWAVIPSKNEFVFPNSDNPDIAAYGKDLSGSAKDQTSSLKERGVIKGVPMATMVGPSLRLAQQLEAIV
jgi:26S proteasome regulatory subunit N12